MTITPPSSPFKSKAHAVLEGLYREYHHPRFLASDPLWYVHQYARKADQEVVAFVAACFAFGNVVSIRKTLEHLLKSLGPVPAEWLKQATVEECLAASEGFVYRWIQGPDLALYFFRLGELLRRHGSLENCFTSHEVSVPQKKTVADVSVPLLGFTTEYQEILNHEIVLRTRLVIRENGTMTTLSPAANSLLPMVAAGSACKRSFLFLRWVCRPADGIDLGLWNVDPARLIMPVDTHVFQAAKLLKLTNDKSPSLAMAQRLTKRLARYDPQDPTRYDFSLCRPGIMGIKDALVEG